MNRRTLAALLTALLAGGAIGLSVTAMTPASAAPARPANPVVIDCANKAQVRPSSFVLACADGNAYLTKMTWTSWTPRLGSAAGTFVENDCVPNCVGGHFHSYPALVVLWGSAPAAHRPGEQRYTEMTLIFTGPRPAVYTGPGRVTYPQTQTWPLWAPS